MDWLFTQVQGEGGGEGEKGEGGNREGDCFVPAHIKTTEASFWPSKYITYIPSAFDEDG